MMRGVADSLIPVARKLIKQKKYPEMFADSLKIQEIYENYTAAFGMIVNQSGFQSAFAIYNESERNNKGYKHIITHLLYDMLSDPDFVNNYTSVIIEKDYELCKNNILNGEHEDDEYEAFFQEASIALKRAIRTFEIVKEK